MILFAFLCVLGAIGLLVLGLARADASLVWASIATSALGGVVVLLASVQRGRALRGTQEAAEGSDEAAPAEKEDTEQAPDYSVPAGRSWAATARADDVPTAEPASSPIGSVMETSGGSADHRIDEVGTAEIELSDAPEIEVERTPEIEVERTPEIEVERTPEIEVERATEIEVERATEMEMAPGPEIDMARGPAVEVRRGRRRAAVVDDVVLSDMTVEMELSVPPAIATDSDWEDSDDPLDEPAEEEVDIADVLTVIDLDVPVLVVDLRPRYHLAGCAHIRNWEIIPIPVNEAREDGFTPCGLCRPDAALATAARRLRSS